MAKKATIKIIGDAHLGPTNLQKTFDALSTTTELMTARDAAKLAGIRKTAAIQAIGELIESGDVELVHPAPTYRLREGATRPVSRWDIADSREKRKRFHLEAAAALKENARLPKKF